MDDPSLQSSSLDSLADILTSLTDDPYNLSLHCQHVSLAKDLVSLGLDAGGEDAGGSESGLSQVTLAQKLITNYYAVGDEIWLDLIQAATRTADLNSKEGVQEVLEVYEKAEEDFLSILILKDHVSLLIDRHEYFSDQSQTSAPTSSSSADTDEFLSTQWTRKSLHAVVSKGVSHISQSHLLWDALRDWEFEMLEKAEGAERESLIEYVDQLLLDRLQQPHSNYATTYQSYSTFTTTYKPPELYESLLVAASKARGRAVKAWDRCERGESVLKTAETALATATSSSALSTLYYTLIQAYNTHILNLRRISAKHLDFFVLSGLYERAVAAAGAWRWAEMCAALSPTGRPAGQVQENGAQGNMNVILAETTLRLLWTEYCDLLRMQSPSSFETELKTCRHAVRSVPGSGEVWARYLRCLERAQNADESKDLSGEDVDEDADMDSTSTKESVADAYARALSTKLFAKRPPSHSPAADIYVEPDLVSQIVPLVLARAGYEKRRMEVGKGDDDIFQTLVTVLEDGITSVRQAPQGDPWFRLEKFLAELYLNLADVPENAAAVWQTTAKHYKTSYVAWTSYIDLLIKTSQHTLARQTFQSILTNRNLDWPDAIFQAWITFEHVYGSVEDVERCLEKIGRVQEKIRSDAQKAAYQAEQITTEQQAANVPVSQTAVPDVGGSHVAGSEANGVKTDMDATLGAVAAETSTMDVAGESYTNTQASGSRAKRKAEDEPIVERNKRAKIEGSPAPLKRDRENCTVFVADLPAGIAEDDLVALFKDCGEIREIKITKLPDITVATVEFGARDSIPAALTKDKKRIHGEEVAVHLAWKSTLYVTNFPEKADDSEIRSLFGQYGTLFDVRWPSKKFKNTRRFCYVQFTSPSSAESALELHNRELEPSRAIQVFISNPERRKDRTDADANEKELYVAGLNKFTTKDDLKGLFSTYGPVKDIRMATEKDGSSKGFAFVEFEQEADARAALAANNHELKKRRIAVTLADTRVRARNKTSLAESGLSFRAETRNRSVRIRNLPPGTQEGLLQQFMEKLTPVKRTEIFANLNEAVIEVESAADAGKLLLHTEPIIFNGSILHLSEEALSSGPSGSGSSTNTRPVAPPTTGGMFIPRTAASRPRAGLGHARKPAAAPASSQTGAGVAGGAHTVEGNRNATGKGQDDFRRMLNGGS